MGSWPLSGTVRAPSQERRPTTDEGSRMSPQQKSAAKSPQQRGKRWRTLVRIERWLDRPMIVLSFVWLALLIWEVTRGIPRPLQFVATAIWVIFIIDFIGRL